MEARIKKLFNRKS